MIMETDSLDGPLFALGSIGAEFTVITPLELASMATDWGSRYVRAGNKQTGDDPATMSPTHP